jgi:two-component system, LytTR family, response regulator
MITAIHVEDEPRNIDLLQSIVTQYLSSKIKLLGSATNLNDAKQLIQQTEPQLVFLDIELNKTNAFELLNSLDKISFEIIFITAFNEYAVKAFRLNAIDYLLKPISIDELHEATEKAIQKIESGNMNNSNLLEAIKTLANAANTQKLALPIGNGIEFFSLAEIIKFEANGAISFVYTKAGKKIAVNKMFKDLEELLPSNIFFRVHNSWIINTQMIRKIKKGKQSFIEMEDNSIVEIATRKKDAFLKLFES